MKFLGKGKKSFSKLTIVLVAAAWLIGSPLGIAQTSIEERVEEAEEETEEIQERREEAEEREEEEKEGEQEEIQPETFNFVVPVGNYSWRNLRLVNTLIGHISTAEALLFTPDGKYLISAGSENDPSLRFWMLKDGKEIERVRAQHTSIDTMILSPNGETLITSGQSTKKANGQDAAINIWNWKTGKYTATFREHSQNITDLVVSPDNKVLVSAALDGVKVWNINPQRPLYSLSGLGDPTYALAMNPNGYIVASGTNKGKVKFWNIRVGKLVSEFTPHQQAVSALAFTPNGEKLVVASYDRTISVWDVSTGKLLQKLTGHSSKVRTMVLSPDGKTLATSSSDGVRIWDIETGELINHLIEENQWAQSLAFSKDGRRLAIGSADFQIRIWEAIDSN
jgi:WD40 repeat protein